MIKPFQLLLQVSILMFLGIACVESNTTQKSEIANAQSVLASSQERLRRPMVMRENLLSERGIHSLDSSALFHLQWIASEKYQRSHGYYLIGKFATTSSEECILILEEGPKVAKAWLMSYKPNGLLIEKKLVYQQTNLKRPPRLHSYLKADTLEITQDGHKRFFSIDQGKFMGIELGK